MNPIIVLPPDEMSAEDVKMLRDNGICVVVSKNPAALKFVDPIPASSSRTQIESAAIQLSRILLQGQWTEFSNSSIIGREVFAKIFVHCLLRGTPLDSGPTQEERENAYFTTHKLDEIQKLAREEARAERAQKRAAAKK